MEKKDLRLMRWDADGFPPINLSESMKDVLELINEVKKLRKERTELIETIESVISYKGLKITQVLCNALQETINKIKGL